MSSMKRYAESISVELGFGGEINDETLAVGRARLNALASPAIPTALTERCQWVCWRYVERHGTITKVPFDARTGRCASSTNFETWATHDEAREACERTGAAGVGIVFSTDDPLCGIDLDGCIVDGTITPEAQAILDDFDSYAEVSPSGKGVKIFLRGRKPAGAKCRANSTTGFDHAEVYDHARYFTVTGEHVAGTPLTIEYRQSELDDLCASLWPGRNP